MLRKLLFVGLGGSGGKTLRFLRDDLQHWLTQIGWTGEFPAGWQMLHLDTPTSQDGSEIKDVPMLPAENYLGLVMTGVDFSSVSGKLSGSGADVWRELASWRVDPTYLQVPITTGAGQYRAVGRTIGLAYADKILSSLRSATLRLSAASAGAELAEIHQLAYGSQASTPQEPVAIVVSSLAGGTGAGLLLDVCDLLRQLPGKWAGNSFGILYASDVFRELGEVATAGVQPNALAALCELMNGYWLTSNAPRASALYQSAGAPVPVAKSGPAYPFLVGAANTKGVSFGDQRSVYSMMGRALRSWTTDPAVQTELIAYTQSNWQNNAAGNAVKADIVVRDHLPVFEAFGYAEVSLGMDRFERYASERLAKLAAVWLTDGHLRWARAQNPDETRTSTELVEAIARDLLVRFLRVTGLHQRGDSNQVIDDLQPAEAAALLEQGTQTVFTLATTGIKDLDAPTWTSRIVDLLAGASEDYERDHDQALRALAREWVESKPAVVLLRTEELVGRYGLPASARVLDLVAHELRAVCSELADEADEFRRWSQDARSAVAAELAISGNIKPQHPAVEAAVHTGLWTRGGYQAEAKRRQVARQLMKEFADGFVVPLAQALRAAGDSLYLKGFVGDGADAPAVVSWPDRAVPDVLAPPRNECLVIELDAFPSRFDELLARSTKAELPGDQLPEARAEVMNGGFLDDEKLSQKMVPRAISVTTRWSPDPALLLGGSEPRTNATFSAAFGPSELLARSRAWMRRQGTAFERFLALDLRSYLDDDPYADQIELGERRASFRGALSAALDSAEPLVQIDAGLLSLLHHKASLPQRAVPSQLPFRDHPMEKSAREILAAKLGGVAKDDLDRYFSTASTISSISITSTLGAAHDPMIFTSITGPIIAGWGVAAQSAAARTNFWNNRRARPVSEFVPASQEVILAMTRGWFTGVLLGKIDRQQPAVVHDGVRHAFPKPLLRDVEGNNRDLLPALLESLGLAYGEVARLHSLAPLAPYVALRDLGVQPGLVSFESAHVYDLLNVELDRWVRTGELGDVLVEPLAHKAMRDVAGEPTAEDRRAAALTVINHSSDEYHLEIERYGERGRRDPNTLGPAYGLWAGMWGIIDHALTQLRAGLDNLRLTDDDLVM